MFLVHFSLARFTVIFFFNFREGLQLRCARLTRLGFTTVDSGLLLPHFVIPSLHLARSCFASSSGRKGCVGDGFPGVDTPTTHARHPPKNTLSIRGHALAALTLSGCFVPRERRKTAFFFGISACLTVSQSLD